MKNKKLFKIHINFATKDTAWGGGNSFLRNLKGELSKSSNYINNTKEADVIIFNAHHHLLDTLSIKKNFPSKIFIHRLGGPMKGLRNNGFLLDLLIRTFNTNVADATIFQSKWSMSENVKNGYSVQKFFKIIGNGVNRRSLKKNTKDNFIKKNKIEICFASWSNNKTKGLETLKYLDKNLDFKKYVIKVYGNLNYNFKNIKCFGPKEPKDLSKIIRKSDIFLFASYKEAYSNMLIEAISSGLPVLTRKASSNTEIVLDNRLLFSNNNEIISKLDSIAKNLSKNVNYKFKILNLGQVASEYVSFSKYVISNIDKESVKKINILNFIKLHIVYYVIKFLLFIMA